MNNFDAIVIGLGGWGSAVLFHLARRGLKVCGVEQFSIGHSRGSSHGESRIIRMAYFSHPDYVPVLRRAYELWRELETAYGEPLMTLNGLLCFGPRDGELIRGLARCYEQHELPHERFEPAEATRRFPQFHLHEDHLCYWDPLGGYLSPERCLRAHIQEAQLAGATLLQGEPVLAFDDSPQGVTVRTGNRTLRAAKLVLATGAFTNRLIAGPVQPIRKVAFWYGMHRPAEFTPDRFPTWIAERDGRDYYGFPTLDHHELKAAEYTGGQPLDDPLRVRRELYPEDESGLLPFLQDTFASALTEKLRHKTCLHEQTVDGHFILDRDPRFENVVIAAGGSGHGYKFCPVIGEITAQLVIDGHSPLRPEIFAARGRL